MALAPARLLLPMRGVEAPHPSTLSSASVCSAAGACPHFTLYFLPPHVQKSSFSVSASVVDNGTYRPSRHIPFRRSVFVDDSQNPFPEERFGPPGRDLDGRARRYSKTDYGNGSRRAWERRDYPSWQKRDIAAEEVKPRTNKTPHSYRGWSASPSTSYAEDDAGETFRNPKLDSRRSERFGWQSRDFDGRARRYGRTDDGNGSRRAWEPVNGPSWQKRETSVGEGRGTEDKPRPSYGSWNSSLSTSYGKDDAVEALYNPKMDRRKSERWGWQPREGDRDGFARQGNAYFDSRSAFRERREGTSGWNAPMFQNTRQGNTPDSFSLQKYNGYQKQKSDSEDPRDTWQRSMESQIKSEQPPDRQGHDIWQSSVESQLKSEQQPDRQEQDIWQSSVESQMKSEQQPDRQGCYMSYTPSTVDYSQPLVQSSFSSQSDVQEREWKEREAQREIMSRREWKEGEAQREETEEIPLNDTDVHVQKEHEKETAPSSGISSISKIIERLRSIEDRIPPLHAKNDGQSRNELADVLNLPSARDYLSNRTSRTQSAELPEKEAPINTQFPWERSESADKNDSGVLRARNLRPLSQAELSISGPELRRLRILAVHLKQRVKIGKHGVTRDAAESIQKKFQTCEVVKVKCEGPPAGNMKKTIETLEAKTGGLVIWRAGSVTVLYRGKDYGQPVSEIVDDLLAKKYESLVSSDRPQPRFSEKHAVDDVGFLKEAPVDAVDGSEDPTGELNSDASLDNSSEQFDSDVTLNNASQRVGKRSKKTGPELESLEAYVLEVDDILKDLGPRYEDWTGPNPVPIDADLLPKSIPNFVPPYRLLPFGVRPNVSNTYATHLRRLSRPLAPHFIIGRDRDLQGLSFAMIKLWEKSEIAKIGVKRGVLNTNHERIAEDLKRLTGGFFLCRDKYSMTFYRGKDFLPPTISGILANRQTVAENLQLEEDRGRGDESLNITEGLKASESGPSWVHRLDLEKQIQLKREAARTRRAQLIAHLERKLKIALQKKEKAGMQLEKVEKFLRPIAGTDDKENLSDEERFMLKKLGLKMKAFLLLGRRGVFSGVVQNMHLHWKHRELVKIVVKERDPVRLHETARMLEAESGGILISVDPTSKGFAIVVYRGKNYTRPPELRPPNLLTKRLALQRSLEIQRRQSLTRHMQGLEEEIAHLRTGLSKMKILDDTDESTVSSKQGDISDASLTNETIPGDLVQESSAAHDLQKLSRRKLRNLCEMGPIFKAVRFSKKGRHLLRAEVLKLSKAPHFLVGRSQPMAAIAKAIRFYFLDHAFVKIGVNYRPRGLSVQDVVEELEDLTGGAAYAQDDFRVILYRGWPNGEAMPLDGLYDVLSPEQLDILEEEEDENDQDDEEAMIQETIASVAAKIGEVEESYDHEENMDEESSPWDMSDEDENVDYERADGQLSSESTLVRRSEMGVEENSDEDQEYVDEEMLPWDMSDESEDVIGEGRDDHLKSELFWDGNWESSDDEIDEYSFLDSFSEALPENDENNGNNAQFTSTSTFVAGSGDDPHKLLQSNVVYDGHREYQRDGNENSLIKNHKEIRYISNSSTDFSIDADQWNSKAG